MTSFGKPVQGAYQKHNIQNLVHIRHKPLNGLYEVYFSDEDRLEKVQTVNFVPIAGAFFRFDGYIERNDSVKEIYSTPDYSFSDIKDKTDWIIFASINGNKKNIKVEGPYSLFKEKCDELELKFSKVFYGALNYGELTDTAVLYFTGSGIGQLSIFSSYANADAIGCLLELSNTQIDDDKIKKLTGGTVTTKGQICVKIISDCELYDTTRTYIGERYINSYTEICKKFGVEPSMLAGYDGKLNENVTNKIIVDGHPTDIYHDPVNDNTEDLPF